MKILLALLIFYSGIVSAQPHSNGTSPVLFKEYLFDMPVSDFTDAAGYFDCSEDFGGLARCLDEIDFLEEKLELVLRFNDKKLAAVLLVSEFNEKIYAKVFGALIKNFTLVMMRSKTDSLDLIALEKKISDRKAFAANITEYETLHLRSGQLSYIFIEETPLALRKAQTASGAEANAPKYARTVEMMVIEDDGEAFLMVEFSLPRLNLKRMQETMKNVKSEKF
jgi:hypothetical protein